MVDWEGPGRRTGVRFFAEVETVLLLLFWTFRDVCIRRSSSECYSGPANEEVEKVVVVDAEEEEEVVRRGV